MSYNNSYNCVVMGNDKVEVERESTKSKMFYRILTFYKGYPNLIDSRACESTLSATHYLIVSKFYNYHRKFFLKFGFEFVSLFAHENR